ncbi:MAG TPA: hypothetical protein PLD59_03875 [Tepidisphaeraceae bacterium]|nr:hypothetical protein [Tepidisphaeraceae bacterium]
MKRFLLIFSAFSMVAWLDAIALGQLTPVVGNGATAFDPEVSIVNSGAVLDAQAVVSHDRRYVTINMAPSNSNVIAIRNFPVQSVAAATGFSGFVGGANPGGGDAAVAAPDVAATVIEPVSVIVLNPSPEQRAAPKILDRIGIIRIAKP